MARIEKTAGYYVRVEHRVPYWLRLHYRCEKDKLLARMREECERIIAEIDRHVDAATAELVTEHEAVCSHCGSDWTEDGDTYNGGCCAEDQEAHEAANKEAA